MVAARLLPADSKRRKRIGRFELIGEIASGGMATVYLGCPIGASHACDVVAIKRLHPHLAEEDDFVRMFFEEARVAALIHHVNVVPIRDVGSSAAGHFLAMDYVEGDTLARRLTAASKSGRAFPIEIGLRIVVDMLLGLHAAHEVTDENGVPLNLVHRDVSPQNLILGLDGGARIMDFGLAKVASTLPGTHAGQLKGKIAYMAPEQAASEELVDRRTDVFAAGIVLWELLTGRRLFRGVNDAVTLTRVVNEPIVPPSRYVEGLAPTISAICMRALERRLSLRFETALEFADCLEVAATRAGVFAARHEVAAYMQAALGPALTQQRLAVQDWMNAAAHSEISPSRGQGERAVGEFADAARCAAVSLSRDRVRSNTQQVGKYGKAERDLRRRWRRWGWRLVLTLAILAVLGLVIHARRVHQACDRIGKSSIGVPRSSDQTGERTGAAPAPTTWPLRLYPGYIERPMGRASHGTRGWRSLLLFGPPFWMGDCQGYLAQRLRVALTPERRAARPPALG